MNEAAFRSLVSGERRGLWPSLLRGGLRLASCGYGAAVAARNAGYDLGVLGRTEVGVPVVSVGNVTTGGTGKTPFVAWLVHWFQKAGLRPAILSRGYRSLDGEANDERLVLDRLCPGVPHVQNPDRIAGARVAIDQHRAQVLVLDDAFQHRRIARDLDVVLVDALNPWGYGHLLPRGLLRESRRALRRVGVMVITRADQASSIGLRNIVDDARRAGLTAPVVEVAFEPETLVNAEGTTAPLADLRRQRVFAFCGIGNPAAFVRVVQQCGFVVAGERSFADHYHYAASDLTTLAAAARQAGAAALITTEKDVVKIPHAALDSLPLWAVRIGATIRSGVDELTARLNQILGGVPG